MDYLSDKKQHKLLFIDSIKKINYINNLLISDKYRLYTNYSSRSKNEIDNYFNNIKNTSYMNKSTCLLDLIQRNEMAIFLMSL